LNGRDLTLEEVEAVAHARRGARLSDDARESVRRSRKYIESLLSSGQRVYGVNTGFGRLADVVIEPDRQRELQQNLLRSHAAGVGRPLESHEVRALMLLRANALARGNSGCRPEVIDQLLTLLDHDIVPVVPESGSVGASGDLAPLAHVALALIGEGHVVHRGSRATAAEALAEEGIEPLELAEKEGLALINGTQATTGLGILALLGAERAVDCAEVAGAMSLDALKGTPAAFRPEVHEARPHAGQKESGRRLWSLISGSEIRESHREGDSRVQDPYCLRCMPQVHGAARHALGYVRQVLETEANSATDNPLVFPEAEIVISAGNFHAQLVSQALDLLVIALADLAAISERRIERMLNPDLSGLSAFLARRPGLESGLMIAQVTAVDLLGEIRVLAHPASVDSVPTSANQEDHVSMGFTAARKARRAVECVHYVQAVEVMVAAEAIERHRPLKSSTGIERALELVRAEVAPLQGDRPIHGDLETLKRLVASGALVSSSSETG
jgi:histidine ammonia-lyase